MGDERNHTHRTLEILENHIEDFSEFKEQVKAYHEKGFQTMEKVDALYAGQVQAARYLANLEALPQIAEKFRDIKNDLLHAALSQNHVPVATMDKALKSQAKILGWIIGVLLTLVISLFGAFITIKIWFPDFFK